MRAPRRSSWSARSARATSRSTTPVISLAAVTHRDVERQHLVAERRLRGREYAVVVGARLVELGDHHGPRHGHLGALAPQRGGGVVDRLVGRDHEQGAVGGPQAGAHLPDEVGVPGGVDEVDLGVAVDHGCDGQRDGAFVRLLGLLEVADGRAVADRSRPGGWPRRRRAASRPRWSCPEPPGPTSTTLRIRSGLLAPRSCPAGLRPPALSAMVCLQVPQAARVGPPTQNTMVLNQLLLTTMFKRRTASWTAPGAVAPRDTEATRHAAKWGEPLAAWGQRGAHVSSGR